MMIKRRLFWDILDKNITLLACFKFDCLIRKKSSKEREEREIEKERKEAEIQLFKEIERHRERIGNRETKVYRQIETELGT